MTQANETLHCVLLAALTVISASAGAVAVGSAGVATSEHSGVEFGSAIQSTAYNGTVDIPLEFTNATKATLAIGGDGANYRAIVDVTDGDGDGMVTVTFDTNTSQSTRPAHFVSTADVDDTATVRTENGSHGLGDPPLDTGTYELNVSPGTDDAATVANDATALSTFTIFAKDDNEREGESNDEPTISAPVTHDVSEELVVMNASNQTLRGTSDLSPGTKTRVNLRTDAVGHIVAESVTVGQNGTWNATFNFSRRYGSTDVRNVDKPGFVVWLHDDDDAKWSGRLVTANDVAVSFDDQQSSGDSVIVDSVTLPVGGYVVIHAADGTVLGHSSRLSPGTSENVTVSLSKPIEKTQSLSAMAHVDSDDDERYDFPGADGPYLRNGAPVEDDAEVRYEASKQSIPGFTLPLTLVALLAIAGIAAVRRE